VRHEDIPEINNPKIRFPVLEGDKIMKEVDSKYNSILIRTEINVPEIPKMNADNK
jgi:hypothetical protein